MASMSPTLDGDGSAHEEAQTNCGLVPRSYQLEMLEASMQRNLIVAMDTGSGKTLIAVLRIQAELERCATDKLVWFCVPTVALAEQQHAVISMQLPSYQARVLSGKDNCEFWTRKTWTEVLKGTRIVVSTHSILLDALMHAFVKIGRLALLIFDEAHRATKDHPANKIMREFYHPTAAPFRPYILGLTASPVINDMIGGLETLEANLDAIARTPKLCRSDLIKSVHKPELIQLRYCSDNSDGRFASTILEELYHMYDEYDLNKDPWIIAMMAESDPRHERMLSKAIMKQKTWCREQLRGIFEKAKRISGELGLWATNHYIHQCIEKFRNSKTQSFTIEETVEEYEKEHLQGILDHVETFAAANGEVVVECIDVTPKVQELVQFLAEQDTVAFAGLIFVETRAEVAILSQLLMRHPLTSSFAVSTFVGESNYSNRKYSVGELADIRNQKTTLDDLRYGIKNLVVTTNALEEGIDVSACNVVICFQKPPNLKSFVQRRGRARKDVSKYVIMLEEWMDKNVVSKWQDLEDLMRKIYEDDMREIRRLEDLENKEPEDNREFCVEKTGAKLNPAAAVSHLYHFCNLLPHDSYVEQAPMFFFENEWGSMDDKMKSISAKVVLPSSVDISVREARSKRTWATEKNAKRDAAFEAYVALYGAGLVNDNLLPQEAVDNTEDVIEKRPNLAEVDQQINIWPQLANQWHHGRELCQNTISLECTGHQWINMSMLLPISLPEVAVFPLHWDADHVLEVVIGRSTQSSKIVDTNVAKQITSMILRSIFGQKMSGHQDDFIVLFAPFENCNKPDELYSWLDLHTGFRKASEPESKTVQNENHVPDLSQLIVRGEGLVRDLSQVQVRFILLNYIKSDDPLYNNFHRGEEISGAPKLLLAVKRFPKRADFLHQVANHDSEKQGPGIRTIPVELCEIDKLPWRMAMFASFVPSILHVVHKTIVVDQLCTGLLAPLNIKDKTLVATAISAPSAHEPNDYQRLEFLGDSILKVSASLALMTRHLIYDEGRLTRAKDHIVSNRSLSVAAIKAGLAPYILTKSFTGKKWRPLYVSDILAAGETKGTREMSTKTLADVVESLIGAAFLDGGGKFTKALECLKIFLPRIDWTYASEAHTVLNELYRKRITKSPPLLTQIEELIGHQFECKTLLLEATTHASYRGSITSDSYQRLEFLGDSILDSIVTTKAFDNKSPIPVQRLHLIRTALVNGHFLGYLCMRLSSEISRTETRTTGPKSVETFDTKVSFALWQAMRHSNTAIATDQAACRARYEELSDAITSALQEGQHYPWTLLARLEPPKPFSDMIESIIAAIWIDTSSSLESCSAFLERLGLISYLNRVLKSEGLALLHPKEELGRLADQESVTYTATINEGIEHERGKKSLSCKIHLSERGEVVSVGNGVSRMEVETRAAEEACAVLRGEGRRLGKEKGQWKGRDEVRGEEREEGGDDDVDDDDEDGDESGEGDEEDERDEETTVGKVTQGGNRKRKLDSREGEGRGGMDFDDKDDNDGISDEDEEDFMSAEEE